MCWGSSPHSSVSIHHEYDAYVFVVLYCQRIHLILWRLKEFCAYMSMSSFLQVFRRTGMLPSTLSPLLVDGLSAWMWISIKVQHKKQSMTCNSNSFWVAIPSFDHLEISWWTPESGNVPTLLHNNNKTWNSREAQSQLYFERNILCCCLLAVFSRAHDHICLCVSKMKAKGENKNLKNIGWMQIYQSDRNIFWFLLW